MIGFQLVVDEAEGPHSMDFTLRDWHAAGGLTLFRQIDINDRGTLYRYRFSRVLMAP